MTGHRHLPWLLCLLLGGCVSTESWEATRLLQDIDAAGGPSTLKEVTPAPRRSTLHYAVAGRPGLADLYEPGQTRGGALVLVPGFTEAGKNDSRVVELARSLARARFTVLVPEVPGSRELRVRLEDKQTIADALRFLKEQRPELTRRGVGVVAISYAAGLAMLATLELNAAARPDFLVGLGGYHDTTAVVTFATTGRYRAPGERKWQRGHPLKSAKWIFLAGNAAVLSDAEDRRRLEALGRECFHGCDPDVAALARDLGAEGRALLALITNDDPARVTELLEALPESVALRLRGLSLKGRDLAPLAGRLILIHGRLDPLIPYSESQALARAVPGTELFLIDGFSHITPRGVGWAGQLQLVSAIKALLQRRRELP
ncbi:alpha/beta fold hydrolase [Pelagibius marinus]|uniref:alpha/beta fold hydrolase n=1 Tax=Pelagibius marinus TaxID=2762760 RepID=UPI001D0465E0|nr:alpha/beta hydrolase [Pelagibius marinus]